MILHRAATAAADALILLAVILCIPLVILAIGLPFAWATRLLLQLGRLF